MAGKSQSAELFLALYRGTVVAVYKTTKFLTSLILTQHVILLKHGNGHVRSKFLLLVRNAMLCYLLCTSPMQTCNDNNTNNNKNSTLAAAAVVALVYFSAEPCSLHSCDLLLQSTQHRLLSVTENYCAISCKCSISLISFILYQRAGPVQGDRAWL